MGNKVYNFKPGPSTLPQEAIQKAQEEFTNYQNLGYGVVEESHRSKTFDEILQHAKSNIRELLNLSDDYAVLFLQGGASLQFSMIPMNLMVDGKPAYYADTGSWASKSIKEAKLFGDVNVVYSGKDQNYSEIGDPSQWNIPSDGSYFYLCTNNTIFGTQYHKLPNTGNMPVIADMSSDILSRQINAENYDFIFAGAQKNLGPAGVTVVIMRKELAERTKENVPTMLAYPTFIEKDSLFNTPPTFAIYMVGLVTDWIKKQGGLEGMEKINRQKADALYSCIDSTDFYQGTAAKSDRSMMNVCFRLPSEDLEKKFLEESEKEGLLGLKGHRSVGGLRASIYNGMTLEGVERLVEFMREFEKANS